MGVEHSNGSKDSTSYTVKLYHCIKLPPGKDVAFMVKRSLKSPHPQCSKEGFPT